MLCVNSRTGGLWVFSYIGQGDASGLTEWNSSESRLTTLIILAQSEAALDTSFNKLSGTRMT